MREPDQWTLKKADATLSVKERPYGHPDWYENEKTVALLDRVWERVKASGYKDLDFVGDAQEAGRFQCSLVCTLRQILEDINSSSIHRSLESLSTAPSSRTKMINKRLEAVRHPTRRTRRSGHSKSGGHRNKTSSPLNFCIQAV